MKKQIKKKLLKGFLLGTLTVCVLGMCAGCGQKTENIENTVTSPTAQEQTGKTGQKSLSWSELTQTGSMDLSYADQFSVTYYGEENYARVIIGEDEKFLVVPGSYFCYGLFLPFGCSGSDHPFRYRPFRLVFRGTEKSSGRGNHGICRKIQRS